MRHKKLLAIAAASAMALLLAACQNKTPTSTFPDENETYSAEVSSVGTSNRFAGVVTASGETKVEKDSDKTVADIKVAAGDDVKKGQVLFTYDGEQAQLSLDKAKLELDQLNLSLQSLNDQKWTLERDRGAAAQSEQLSYTIQIQEVDTNIRETTYNIGLKEKEVAKFEEGIKKLEVKSPINGKVQSVNTENSLSPGGNELPFIMLMNTGTYRVKAYVNEINAMELYEGAEVTVYSRVDDRTWTGKISTVDFENPAQAQQNGDMGDNSEVTSTSKYPFYVELDDAEGLLLGQHVFVEVNVEFTDVTSDPGTGIEDENGIEGQNVIGDENGIEAPNSIDRAADEGYTEAYVDETETFREG